MPSERRIERLIGVYDADGGLRGELSYVVGKLRGTAHCSLCDVTHGMAITGKRAWRTFRDSSSVPFDLVHRNERTSDVVGASDGRMPCVLARVGGDLEFVLGPEQLDAVGGDIGRFAAALDDALASAGLSV
jgi:hypothetical protein